jgi:hypothetical protein
MKSLLYLSIAVRTRNPEGDERTLCTLIVDAKELIRAVGALPKKNWNDR